jgi:hypothetical protein
VFAGAFVNFQPMEAKMPCDTRLKANQTISQRKEEVKKVVTVLDRLIASGQVIVKVGPQGAVAFNAWSDSERDGVTDACAYRQLMAKGSALAKAKIAQAEMMAGRSVNRQVVGQGAHSHDNGVTWHDHKG